MKKFIKPLLLLFMFMVSPGWAASGNLNAEKCFEWLGNEKFILSVYFNNNESVFPTISGRDCKEAVKTEIEQNKEGMRFVLLGGASGSGTTNDNAALADRRINTVKQLFEDDTKIRFKWNGLDINTASNSENEPTDRVVHVLFINDKSEINLTELDEAYLSLTGFGLFDAERSVWKNAQGEFNTARLASDSVAGVVLGTAGGLITSSVMKKKQAEQGFEDLKCVIGGQSVAGWGDEFNVGIQ